MGWYVLRISPWTNRVSLREHLERGLRALGGPVAVLPTKSPFRLLLQADRLTADAIRVVLDSRGLLGFEGRLPEAVDRRRFEHFAQPGDLHRYESEHPTPLLDDQALRALREPSWASRRRRDSLVVAAFVLALVAAFTWHFTRS